MVLPFENTSKAPGIEWISESFPELLGQRMSSPSVFVIGRDERIYAFDRAGIPSTLRPSRATIFGIAEQLDADYAVFGSYNFDGQIFSASAQLLDLQRLRLAPEVKESGPLLKLIEIQTALAWDLLRQLQANVSTLRQQFVSASAPIRLNAFENYIRGIIASTRQEKIRHLREAVRMNPVYMLAIFQLGKAYFAGRVYETAASWLARIPKIDPLAREANFYIGMAAYYLGDFERAESAFAFLSSRLPLTEVYNNLGVVSARRGKKSALDFFQKAVHADPNDPDYRFNLGLTLYRAGDHAGAPRQLREAVALRPNDSEAHESRLAKTDSRSHALFHVGHGRELISRGFVNEAEADFREAIVLDPANSGAHAGLARVLENKGDDSGARREAVSALRLQASAEAFLVLARVDLRDNRVEAASEEVGRALALEPANAHAQALKRAVAAKMAESNRE